MKKQTEKTMKAVGASLALGAAVAMAGSAMNDNPMRNVKKTAKKAINTFSNKPVKKMNNPCEKELK